MLAALYAAIPESARKVFFNPGIDDMSGSDRLRQGVQGGESAPAIVASWSEEVQRFLNLRRDYLLYRDQPAAR